MSKLADQIKQALAEVRRYFALFAREQLSWRSCLPKAEVNVGGDAPVILAANGGLPQALPPSADPIADWLDLMEVVEALCPEWPLPEPPQPGWVYRL